MVQEVTIISTLHPRKVTINRSVLLNSAQQGSVLSRMKNILVETGETSTFWRVHQPLLTTTSLLAVDIPESSSQRGDDNIDMAVPSVDLRGGVMDEVTEDLTV